MEQRQATFEDQNRIEENAYERRGGVSRTLLSSTVYPKVGVRQLNRTKRGEERRWVGVVTARPPMRVVEAVAEAEVVVEVEGAEEEAAVRPGLVMIGLMTLEAQCLGKT